MQKILQIVFVLMGVYQLQAQEFTLKGAVSDIGGSLPGVSVTVVETGKGVATDFDGNYAIKVEPNQTIAFSFIGYTTQKVKISNQTELNIYLEAHAENLEEVIIQVPYGTANKKTYTGSVGLVSAKTIGQTQVSNVSRVLEGSVAGVQSFAASGQPGSEAEIRIRGIGSINADSKPLYVVDGVPYEGGLSAIAPADIESISVLKDATAATLYGSRAANGVIMITTKRGVRNQEPQIEISAKYGTSSRARSDYKTLGTNQYMELYWEAMRNGRMDTTGEDWATASQYATDNLVNNLGINPYGLNNPQPVGTDGKLRPGLQPLWNDNWTDALSQSANYTDVNVRVSGGGAKSRYFVSGGFLNNQGYIKESGFKRFNFRSNIVIDAKDWLELGLNASASHSIQDYPKQDDSAIGNVIGFGRNMPSFYPIYERDLTTGAYLLDPETGKRIYDFGTYRASSYARHNLVATLPLDKAENKFDIATVRTYAQIKFLDNLKFKTSLNIDYNSEYKHNVTNPEIGPSSATGGGVSMRNTRTVSMTYNNVLNYDLDLDDKNSLAFMVGQEYYQFKSNYFGGAREQIAMLGYDQPDAASRLVDFYGKADEYKMLSFFGNAQYSYDKKYYLSASYRADGSSRFAKAKRWGGFWSVGASWRIIDEDFMQSYRDTWLNELVFRASYGAQGNDKVGYYAYQELYDIYNNLGNPGLVASRLETPELSWESNMNMNIGFDFAVLDNRLSGTVEYFERSSKDLLFSKSIAPSLGFTSILENVGKMKNYGLELSLEGYPIRTADWKWKLGMNITTYKNKIVSLPSDEMFSGTKRWAKGGSLYDFYLQEWAGPDPQTGKPRWYGTDDQGNRYITDNYSSLKDTDKVKSGNSLPKFSGGFNTDLSYKNWQIVANFSYNIGGKIYNGDKAGLMSNDPGGGTWSVDMLDRWTPENPYANVGRLTTADSGRWTYSSDRFLVDRSFLKLKTLSLAYNFPQEWLDKVNIGQASLYLQAENLFTWTKQQGLDPEQNFDGTTYYRYPAMKTISVGLNLKL